MENISLRTKKFHHQKHKEKIISAESKEYYPNELTIKTIKEAELGINMHGPYDTVEELMKDLMDDA